MPASSPDGLVAECVQGWLDSIPLSHLKEYFECPVCFNVPRCPPIFQCEKVSPIYAISLKFLSIAGPHDLWNLQTQGAELSTVQGSVQGAQAGLCREDAGDGASALQV